MINYIIYARKSTDVEDKQVRSIEDQLAELRDFAKRECLKVVSELVEKRSAKVPGRPIFGDMVKRIERDGSIGILAWHPDRLARNSVDGGRIIYLVDTGRIVAIHERWKPRKSPKNNPLPFCGLLHCATCGCGVTGDEKWKHQKNGNVHHYIYYHCIKRSRFIKCPEPGVRSEKLDRQLSGMLRRFSLKENWTKKLMILLDTDRKETVESYLTFCQALRTRINIINEKLKILLDSHLDHAIDRDTYTKKKAQLLLDKKTLDEKLAIAKKNRTDWTASAEQWMKEAENLPRGRL